MWKFIATFLLALTLGVGEANATCGDGASNCFWIPGSGSANWSATTNWSATSGGASCSCTPATGDSIVFDANSGTNGSNIDANISITNFTATNSTAVPLTQGGVTVTVTGTNVTFNSTIAYAGVNQARVWAFRPTGTNVLVVTSAGQRFGAIDVNGATGATVRLADAMRVDASTNSSLATLTQGIFDLNNFSFTAANFASGNTNTRTLTFGASNTITITGDDSNVNAWDVTATNLTLTCGTGTLAFTHSTASAPSTFRHVSGTACTTGTLALTVAANSTGVWFLYNAASFTFRSVALSCPNVVRFAAGTAMTVSGASGLTTPSCAASTPLLVYNTAIFVNTMTITLSSGVSTISYTTVSGMDFAGSGSVVANNSFNAGGNTGNITINAPSAGGGGGGSNIIGSSL